MDIVIYAADPNEVDADEVFAALEALDYFVASVEVIAR